MNQRICDYAASFLEPETLFERRPADVPFGYWRGWFPYILKVHGPDHAPHVRYVAAWGGHTESQPHMGECAPGRPAWVVRFEYTPYGDRDSWRRDETVDIMTEGEARAVMAVVWAHCWTRMFGPWRLGEEEVLRARTALKELPPAHAKRILSWYGGGDGRWIFGEQREHIVRTLLFLALVGEVRADFKTENA